mmetsp:Transcript_29158/g.52432  ORF Transcript_29158/g.52432 Transcript_29158/m.52432 type:complete len:80 (-) Transcript_29158:626-865(-)
MGDFRSRTRISTKTLFVQWKSLYAGLPWDYAQTIPSIRLHVRSPSCLTATRPAPFSLTHVVAAPMVSVVTAGDENVMGL